MRRIVVIIASFAGVSLLMLLLHNNYNNLNQFTSVFNEYMNRFKSQIKAAEHICKYADAISIDDYIKQAVPQNDHRIVQYLTDQNVLVPPSRNDVPYNLENPRIRDPSAGQTSVILKILDNQKDGFFIECGGLDGETRSNTLYLERYLGWKGLLVEGDPSNYNQLINKNRKAWSANCCLALHKFPHVVSYKPHFNIGKISGEPNVESAKNDTINVQCFPIFSLLSAIGVTNVDYFSLDVEGHELSVLKTIPFDMIYIKVLSVEFSHISGRAKGLTNFMKTKNYRVVTKVIRKHQLAHDLIFVHNDFIFNATLE